MSDHGDDAPGWVLLLAQLPASPSSPRVTLWRRAKAVGAVGLQNGAWVLPGSDDNVEFFRTLASFVRDHNGAAHALSVRTVEDTGDDEIIARFRSERSKEFAELNERGVALLSELDRETSKGNFSFAELEENEQVLERLAGWLDKIVARDFFPDERTKDAAELLDRCRRAVEGFTGSVYRAEGVAPELPPTTETGE
ncbi:MAG: Chromate resistance protein ChrB [Pseudonocardia sediminis]